METAKFDEPIGKLTLREAWEWYIQPAIDRAKEMQKASEGGSVDSPSKVFTPQTEEEAIIALAMLGVKVPEKPPNG